MCRGFQQQQEEEEYLILNIKAFYVGLCMNPPPLSSPPPPWMTLCYLPRMNASPLEINNSNVPLHSPAFITLHRLISSPPPTISSPLDNEDDDVNNGTHVVYYGSREPVKVRQGSRFELYLRDHKLAKGVFTKDWNHHWKMDCSSWCGVDNDDHKLVNQVHVCVSTAQATLDHDVALTAKLELVKNNIHYTTSRRRRRRRSFILEEIPEETEFDLEKENDDHDCCCPSSSSSSVIMEQQQGTHQDIDMEEVVGWAVDIGIWVICLGFGLLLSKASSSPPKNNTFLRRTTTRTRFITRL